MTEKDFLYFVAGQEKYLIRKAWARIGDHAEDVFQETILSFLAPGPDGTPGYTKYPGHPNQMFVQEFRKVFFFRTVDYIRQRNKGVWKNQSPLLDKDLDLVSVDGPDVAHEERDKLYRLPLWRLTDKQLQALDLHYGHGLTTRGAATALGVVQGTFNEHLANALKTLHEWDEILRSDVEMERYLAQGELVEALWKERGSLVSVLPALIYRLVVLRGPPVAIDRLDPGSDGWFHGLRSGGP